MSWAADEMRRLCADLVRARLVDRVASRLLRHAPTRQILPALWQESMRGIDPLLRTLALSPLSRFCRLGTSSRNRFCSTMTTEPEPAQITIPEGYTLHTENTTHILLPPENQAFLNPVQEFNRDLSVACIRTWTELVNEEKEVKWRRNQERRAKQAERRPKAKRAKSEHIMSFRKCGQECSSNVNQRIRLLQPQHRQLKDYQSL